jgi:ADP-heptose:LPS heptosyltransferase
MVNRAFQRILYISPGGIGNLVMAIPALRALRAAYPGAVISLLSVEPGTSRVLDHEGLIDDVIIARRSLNAIISLIGELRRRRFDCALTSGTVNPLTAGVLMAVSGIPVRAGEDIFGQGIFYTVRVPYQILSHERDGALSIVEALGIEPAGLWPDLTPVPDEARAASEFLRRHGCVPGDVLAGIHPGSAASPPARRKRWPPESFIEVIRRLHGRGVKVVLAAGPQERDLARLIAQGAGVPVINTDAALSLRETAALLRCCRVVISNDSGVAHISAAVGAPLVVLFGPTQPARVAPKGRRVTVLQTPETGPVSGITPDEVWAAVGGILE